MLRTQARDIGEYPRVLIIDPTPFNWARNNGIVKSNLFKGWPKDRVAQIDYSNIQPSFDVCSRYWKLRKIDIIKALFGTQSDRELREPENTSSDEPVGRLNPGYDNRPAIERKLSFLPSEFRLIIGELVFRLPTILSGSLRKWIEEFRPDIIYSITSTAPMLLAVVKVSRLYKIPIVPYFTDDWVTSLYKGHPLAIPLRRSMQFWFKECLELSPVRLTPCELMKEEYEKRYGGTFITVMYPVDEMELLRPTVIRDQRGPIRFVFIGSLEPNRWRTLRMIGEALSKLRSNGIYGELAIYAYPEEIKKYGAFLSLAPALRIMGTAAPDEILRLQQDADVLVHVESFDSASRLYTKYSLSTKIPQYMMAGACIFAYGPCELASIRYIRDSNAGMVVGEEIEAGLVDGLRKLIEDSDLRHELGEKARLAAVQRHDSNVQRKKFREIMAAVARQQVSNQ